MCVGETMRRTRLNLQGHVPDQLRGTENRRLDRHDPVVAAVDNQGRHIKFLEIFPEIRFGEGLDAGVPIIGLGCLLSGMGTCRVGKPGPAFHRMFCNEARLSSQFQTDQHLAHGSLSFQDIGAAGKVMRRTFTEAAAAVCYPALVSIPVPGFLLFLLLHSLP